MRTRSALLLLGLLGCTKAGPSSEPITNPSPGAKPPPVAPSLAVQITAVTLGDDCGSVGLPARSATPADAEMDRKRGPGADHDADWQQPCEQTSMQLAVTGAPTGDPTKISVKKVELYDDKGTLIGELTSRNPTVWAQTGTYGPWDQMVAPAQALSVSYALSAPDWRKAGKRYDRNYTLKAVLTIGSSDRSVQRDVRVDAPAPMPAMVDT
jgi:hypothetical protein